MWVTATAPYVVMFVLLIRGLTLEGSLQGVKFYLTVDDWTKLKDPDVIFLLIFISFYLKYKTCFFLI